MLNEVEASIMDSSLALGMTTRVLGMTAHQAIVVLVFARFRV
jgi:hypothetical protein